jgi:hypothetical protein
MIETFKRKNGLWDTRWLRDVIIPLIIILVSISLYIHLFFSKTENYFTFFNYKLQHYYFSNDLFVWVLLSCVTPITLLSIWFFTSIHLWRNYILFPLFIFIYEFCARFINIDNLTTLLENMVFKFLLSLIVLGGLILIDKFRLTKQLKRNYLLLDLEPDLVLNGNSKKLYYKLSEWTSNLESIKGALSKEQYLKKLYQTRHVLDEESSFINLQPNGGRNKRRIFELISSIILASIPILYILSRLIPEGPKSFSYGWFYIHDHGFKDLHIFFWYIFYKIFALLPLMIWFISSKNWWRYAIMVPITLFTYQIWEMFKDDSNVVDQFELVKAAPAILFIIGLILFLSFQIQYRHKLHDIYEDILNEINLILEELSQVNSNLNNKRKEFDLIKADNSPESLEKNRASLIKIREALIAELNYKKAE